MSKRGRKETVAVNKIRIGFNCACDQITDLFMEFDIPKREAFDSILLPGEKERRCRVLSIVSMRRIARRAAQFINREIEAESAYDFGQDLCHRSERELAGCLGEDVAED